ncbi:MAG TPA: recombinase family protein [Gemmataceae bacterium]|nr:recombinase family protein [Gemmataceae bacterium]
MTTSELVTPAHLARQAIIYVRQSSPNQALSNQESLKLQYALTRRATELGWKPTQVEVIDADLGQTGSTTEGRPGFKDLVTQVTLGQVGIILSYDVTRLSRNCSDWYQLLDLCGYRHCLIGDRDGVYDPATTNGRLLLGLKGQISELELHTLRARLTAGLLNKAARGELALTLPVGLIRDPSGTVTKHPHREVQSRIDLLFATFLRVKSISQVVAFCNEHALLIPRREPGGDLVWRKPSAGGIGLILLNPAHAGAFVYGRTRSVPKTGSPRRHVQERLPLQEWKICIRDKYPAYVDWDTYLRIRALIWDNRNQCAPAESRGVARSGKALLHGLTYCGICGHKMFVQYKAGMRYVCAHLRRQRGLPLCQYLPAASIDDHVVGAFFDVLSPTELDVYAQVSAATREQEQVVQKARSQQVERLRYQARLAERQFQQADPDNRLVTAELERRWELALQELKEAEESLQRDGSRAAPVSDVSPELRQALEHLGQKLPELWQQDALSQVQKKSLLRCLIEKVVLRRSAPDTVQARVVWKGGDTSSLEVPVTVNSLARLSFATQMEKATVKLARRGKADEEIAQELTRRGYRSPHAPTVLPSTVKHIRLRHGIAVERARSYPRRVEGYLTVPQIARSLRVPLHWLHDRIHNGTIRVKKHRAWKLYLFPDNPKTLAQFKQLQDGKVKQLRF